MDLDNLRSVLQEECQVTPFQKILIGVSGGADSLCLLDCLHKLGFNIHAAHFDHRLRPDSAQDASLVDEFCRKRSIPLIVEGGDVRKYAAKSHSSIEESARILRYKFLFASAKEYKFDAIAIAHHADDQIETILMHLLRGTGLNGLHGMLFRTILTEYDPSTPIIRPFLHYQKEMLLAYCRDQGIKFAVDTTNFDSGPFRNRIRLELVPILETYNPRFKEVLLRMGGTLAGDSAILDSYSENLMEQVDGRKHNQTIKLNHTKFRILPDAEQRLVLRKVITNLDPTIRNIGYNNYLTACRFINAPNLNRQLDWCEKISISIIEGDIWIHKTEDSLIILEYPSLMDGQEISSLRDGTWEIGNGWRVSMAFSVREVSGQTRIQTEDQWQAKLNLDNYSGPIVVRRSRPGEIYSPMGLNGHRKKVSDFMIDKKVPRQVRSHFPIVANKDEILWIPGFQPAEKCRIEPSTRQILQISFYHKC